MARTVALVGDPVEVDPRPARADDGDDTAPLMLALAAFVAMLMLVMLSLPVQDANMCPAAAYRPGAAGPSAVDPGVRPGPPW